MAIEGEVALGLSFQGSYSQAKVKEPVYGGHASAMGPAPAPAVADAGVTSSPVTFDERVQLPTRTWDGGPTKDHILESPGNGVALVDVDGDGWLDIYLVTAAELDALAHAYPPSQRALPQPRRLEIRGRVGRGGRRRRGVGQRRVRRRCRRRRPPRSLRHQLGPELPVPQPRRRHASRRSRRQAGVAAGGWSTGCTFLDADADGDLDLYVARYVEHDLGGPCSARSGRSAGATGPRSWSAPPGLPGEADLFFENIGDGTFREASRRARAHRRRPRLRLRRRRHRLRRRRRRRSVRRQRLEPELPVSQPRQGPLRERRACWRAWP